MGNARRDRRSYSLFKSNDGRSTLCDMVARLESDLENAKAENVKLRELTCMMFKVAGVAEYATDAEWQTITNYMNELGIEVES